MRGSSASPFIEAGEEFSFEFFPPRSSAISSMLRDTTARLRRFCPRFVSVTYGAGGSTRDATLATLLEIKELSSWPVAGHLTCVGESRRSVNTAARTLWDSGVRHIVALRGDPPKGDGIYRPHPNGYRDAAELVAGLKRIGDFEISVAAYPEGHPDAASPARDLDSLKRKVDAGANRIITQFCFHSDRILRFVESVRAVGIEVPISVGILPVGSFENMVRLSGRCGATVPEWMHRVFTSSGFETLDAAHIAESIALKQCIYLRENGLRCFHFYTLNRADLTAPVCRYLRIHSRESSTRSPGPRMLCGVPEP